MAISDKYNHFYITLPSSGSLDLYPDNTVTSFTTALNREINLEDIDYEVALVELHIHGIVKNITEKLDLMTVYRYPKNVTTNIYTSNTLINDIGGLPPGYYRTSADIINYINSQLPKRKFLEDLKIEIVEKKLKFKSDPEKTEIVNDLSKIKIKIEPIFEKLMFKDYHETVSETRKELYTYNEIKEREINIMLPTIEEIFSREAFIYCDICEYSDIGSNLYPLLRTVTMPIGPDKYYGSIIFNSPHYVKLRDNRINTIFIYIKSLNGEPWPILQGHCTLKLHFRPINYYH